MKLKGGWTYTARLTGDELEIIKEGLQALLVCYDGDGIDTDYFASLNLKSDVEKLVTEIEAES